MSFRDPERRPQRLPRDRRECADEGQSARPTSPRLRRDHAGAQRAQAGAKSERAFRLKMKLERRERVLERVLGLAGRRGYEVIGVSADLVDGGKAMNVLLTLESERSAELLAKHLSKLHDVAEVRCLAIHQ